jgi:hypothetical protein
MTDTTKFASPVNDVKLPASPTTGQPARESIDEVGDSMRRTPGRWGSAGAGLLAAAAAVGVLIWRRQHKPRTPREKAARAWRDAKSKARTTARSTAGEARDAASKLKRSKVKKAKSKTRSLIGR